MFDRANYTVGDFFGHAPPTSSGQYNRSPDEDQSVSTADGGRNPAREPVGTGPPPGSLPPEISIISPCFNAVRHLRDAIESVAGQQGVRVEHIVVDAGSKDGTLEILKQFPALRWISEPDRGQSDAFNKG